MPLKLIHILKKYYFKFILKITSAKKIFFVFGDSHCNVFYFINSNYPLYKYHFDITLVGGATALGMVNPNSRTNSLDIFKKKILSINNKNSNLLFCLGEVDTGFVIWYRSIKYNETIEDQLNKSITNYFSFLKDLQNLGYRNIFVLSTPLPTIQDNQDWGEVANLRKEVKASQKERTELTLQYNRQLKKKCSLNNITFIGLDNHLLDKNENTIKKIFLNSDKNDHHLDNSSYSKLIIKSLKNIPTN